MAEISQDLSMQKGDAPPARPSRPSFSWAWVGVLPFFLFALLFLFLPSVSLFIGSFQDAQGRFTFANFGGLFTPSILNAYWITIRISAFTALVGGLFGFFLAYAVVLGGLPRWVRTSLMTFSTISAWVCSSPISKWLNWYRSWE